MQMQAARSPIPGPNILLMGDSGTGKTHSLGTFVADWDGAKRIWRPKPEPHLELFCVFTEPGMEVISAIPCTHLHWVFIPPARESWATMLDVQGKINTLSPKQLLDLPDMGKQNYSSFLNVLRNFQNFTCARCGKPFGDVTTWGTNRILAFDSMSGLAIMSMQHVVGGKPVKSPQNWAMAMDGIEALVNKLTMDTRCWFVMTAHLERELDEVTGVQQIMASTLGRKLAPKIPRFFSEVIQAARQMHEFFWVNSTTNTTTKARHLPLSTKISPTFQSIIVPWQNAGGIIEHEQKPGAPSAPQISVSTN